MVPPRPAGQTGGTLRPVVVVAERAAATPDAVALTVDGGDDLSYGTWDQHSNAIARGLSARGIATGDRIGLLFHGTHWGRFATAYLGVAKAGAVPVLLSAGASRHDLSRALAHSEVKGLLCPPHLTPDSIRAWAVDPGQLLWGQDRGPLSPPAGFAAGAELVYPGDPLSRPRPLTRSGTAVGARSGSVAHGSLVHGWAPGSWAGQFALGLVLVDSNTDVAVLAPFDPQRLCAVVGERRAAAVGLTPALAAALLASGAPATHDLRSVEVILLSAPPSPVLLAGLRDAFPRAAVVEVDSPGATPSDDAAPVAVSQEAMVWHEQFTPGSFNLPCLVRRYQGPLDVAAFEWVMAELVRRHEPLRTTFEVTGGKARQVVAGDHPDGLVVVDLAHLSGPPQDVEVARLLADATRRPFDLVDGPLFQPRLLRLAADDHLLVVRLHHTVFDDWSVDVFRREVPALYAARLAGSPPPLAQPETRFGDFARRQRARLDGEAGVAQRAWWRAELQGAPLAVQLSIADPDAPAGTRPQPGGPVRLDLSAQLSAQVRALAPQLRATPFMTLLAAFSVLLGRETGQEDMVIATVVANRNSSDLEGLIGCFTKKVPIRLRVDGDPTFPALVARTRAALMGALSHQDLAFDAAVHEGLGGAASSHGVVPQVAVVFQGETPQRVPVALPGLTSSRFEPPAAARSERHFSTGPSRTGDGASSAPWGDGMYLDTFLILSVLEGDERLALVARGAFHRPAGLRLLQEFEELLGDIVSGPSRPISQLSTGPGHVEARPRDDDVLELRGLRARRSRTEAALAQCPGVREVAVVVGEDDRNCPRLAAYVVPDGACPPALSELREALWAVSPGSMWPATMTVVDALPRLPGGGVDVEALPAPAEAAPEPSADATLLAALWGEVRGREATTDESYWQDFSFLQALAEVREAGMTITDDQVAHCRTLEMLATALRAARARAGGGRPVHGTGTGGEGPLFTP